MKIEHEDDRKKTSTKKFHTNNDFDSAIFGGPVVLDDTSGGPVAADDTAADVHSASQTHTADVFNVKLNVGLVSKNLACYIKCCCAGINTME